MNNYTNETFESVATKKTKKNNKKVDWKDNFKPVQLSDTELDIFLAQCQRESDHRKAAAEWEKRRAEQEKLDSVKTYMWAKVGTICNIRESYWKKSQRILEMIYKVNFDYDNAGLINISKRRNLKAKLDSLWKGYRKAMDNHDRLNEQVNQLIAAIELLK